MHNLKPDWSGPKKQQQKQNVPFKSATIILHVVRRI